tara:strand:- start:764 stop:1585 length:822 start_codon:yes stop_codon:yes gene_type:complete
MTSNEERRLEALKKLGVIGTNQGDIFDIYSELALEVSGFFAATCSLIDVDTQHGISLCSLNGELEKMTEGKPVKVERAQSPCAYTILTPEPLLVPDCREHEIFKNAGAVKAGMIVAYAGFPIINKDNYVFGTICLFDPKIKVLENQEVKLLEKLTKRLAHQLDTQAEQKAITAEKISGAINVFTETVNESSLEDFNFFLNICAGRDIELKKCKNLKNQNLCSVDKNGNMVLTDKGQKLQFKMGLQTRTLNKRKVEGEAANVLVDSMLSELEEL